jgi:UDP-glucuronate decarboxylase
MAYQGPFPGAVNLGNPVELTVGDLAEKVLAMTGSSSRIVTRPLPVDDPRRRRPDITRAKQLLGWSPRTSLEVGLKSTIAWFSDEMADDGKSNWTSPVLESTVRAGHV